MELVVSRRAGKKLTNTNRGRAFKQFDSLIKVSPKDMSDRPDLSIFFLKLRKEVPNRTTPSSITYCSFSFVGNPEVEPGIWSPIKSSSD